MSQNRSTPLISGVHGRGPQTLGDFVEIRQDALDRWKRHRFDTNGEEWECRWQDASRTLPHQCSTPGCPETHVSLYCSFSDAAQQLDDLLTDERLDHVRIGTAPDRSVLPSPESDNPDTNALYRFYVRVLWATEVFLDDLQQLLQHATGTTHPSRTLSKGTPLNVKTLRAFINHVGKHGAKDASRIHCWNHHAEFFFEDSNPGDARLGARTVLSAHRMPSRNAVFDALTMPKLGAIIDTLTTALRNFDAEIYRPDVLAKLALAYGRCW